MSDRLRIVARLASPLAGEAPELDALLEWAMSAHHKKDEPGYKVDRKFAAPELAALPIPILRRTIGGWPVGCCSSPIVAAEAETVEHFGKRLSVENARLLDPDNRRVVATTNSWTKSYRLPLRIRAVDRIVWFAIGERRSVQHTLKQVRALGQKVSDGYGRVASWEVESGAPDVCWFADGPHGRVLMRSLPAGDELPKNLVGYRTDFGPVCPPYWHHERYCERVVPC